MGNVYALAPPEVKQSLVDNLKARFPAIKPHPSHSTIEEIWYNAGMQAIIDYMQEHVSGSVVIGGAELVGPDHGRP